MNGYGHFLPAFWWTKLLWASVALLLVLASTLLWVRGTDTTGRLREARRWGPASAATLALGLLVSLGAGGFIFYNTNVLNQYLSPKNAEKRQVAYEKQYRRYKDVPQPRITAVNLATDLYPSSRAVRFRSQFMLVNKHPRPLWPSSGAAKDKKPVAPLLLAKHRLKAGDNKLQFIVNQKPATVAVDPYHEIVDRILDDNEKEVKL